MRARVVVVAIVGAALLTPAAAGAATVTMSASTGPAASSYVWFRAARGERNRVSVHLRRKTLVIADHGVERLRFRETDHLGRCDRIGPRALVCPRVPVVANLRDGDDTFVASPGGHGRDHPRTHPLELQEDYTDTEGAIVETTIVIAGSGDDTVRGSRSFDTIIPGHGRDDVDGRGGGDAIRLGDDGARDRVAGGAGIDSVDYGLARRRVRIDLSHDVGRVNGRDDSLTGFERAHGGPKDDVLLGSKTGDALYGEEGHDMIAGRRGNDLLVGDSPIATSVSANDIRAGDGADVIDARGYAQAHPPSRKHLTSRIDCGPGRDRVLSETDDSVVRNCQGAVFRIQNLNGLLTSENDLYGLTMKLWPVARDEQSVTYEVPCPSAAQEPNTGCSGSITLTSPPPGGNEPGTVYGSTDFDLEPGERAPVRVELSPEGRQAVVHDPVDVEIDAALSQGAGAPAEPARFGWEQVLGPANP